MVYNEITLAAINGADGPHAGMNASQQTNGKHRLSLASPELARLSRAAPHFFAPSGPFIGRERELAYLARCFEDPACRLLTLVGLGGSGKTRIAWEAASRVASRFAQGVVFVPLAPLASPDFLVSTIASALGHKFHGDRSLREQLLDALSQRDLLLVLDNFEHALADVDLVADLLRAAPGVRVLVTSRERLNLREEWVFDITGLDYPLADDDPHVERYSAVQLFVERARRVKADFRLTRENLPDVIHLCRLVEGLPLGLELAASWTRSLSCRAIATEIERNLDLLSTYLRDWPEKHRSLRAVFAHSWTLLSPHERRTLESLAVFRGGFRLEAAQAVCGADVATLAGLVDKGLLRVWPGDRYDMHSLVQRYALEQLEAAGLGDQMREAHSAHFAAHVAARTADLKGGRQLEAIRENHSEFDNLLAAWNWAVQRRDVARISAMLEGYSLTWMLRGCWQEFDDLSEAAARQFAEVPGEEARRLWGRLIARSPEETVSISDADLRAALAIAQRHDDHIEIGYCLNRLGTAAYAAGDFAKAEALLEESLASYRRSGDPFYVAMALFDLSVLGHSLSWQRAKELRDESLRLRIEIGDKVGTLLSLSSKALAAARVGDYAEAERLWRERIALSEETGNPHLMSLGYTHLAHQVLFVRGDFAEARAAASEAVRLAEPHRYNDALGWAQVTLGLLACMDEDYATGMALCEQGAQTSARTLADIPDFAAWGMCLVVCGLDDVETLRERFPAALRHSTKLRGEVGIALCLPPAAILLAREGQPERAVEWLALAFTHPIRASGWMEKWPLLDRWRAEMRDALGAAVYDAAWERGTRLDLEAVAAELHRQHAPLLSAPSANPHPAHAEHLTERELEVLRLMAAGYSNREIAEKLVISVGTVKAHTSNIYGKLGVQNRVQAVAQANLLGLL